MRRVPLKTAKIFRSRNSQAVRIPKEFQLEGSEVEIVKKGSSPVVRPCRRSWAPLFDSLNKFSDDFMKDGRKQLRPEKKRTHYDASDAGYHICSYIIKQKPEALVQRSRAFQLGDIGIPLLRWPN
jgi:antitoxin VapB